MKYTRGVWNNQDLLKWRRLFLGNFFVVIHLRGSFFPQCLHCSLFLQFSTEEKTNKNKRVPPLSQSHCKTFRTKSKPMKTIHQFFIFNFLSI